MTDTTEARYAEIGRLMYQTGDYITPYFTADVPFWGKAPLSFWATAVSFNVFGVNEFAATFPHFLLLLAALGLIYMFVRRHLGYRMAAVTACIATTMPAFLYLAGGVMTDPAMVFAMTLSFAGFYNALHGVESVPAWRSKWGYAFFIGVGLSMLAKGPIGVVLTGIPIFLFILLRRRWTDLWRKLPWIGGTLLTLAIFIPWYVMAELKTPGFLDYFIIGEHILRFVSPGWGGDLYGTAHREPIGMIWIFYLLFTMPWSLYFVVRMFSRRFRAFVPGEWMRSDIAIYSFLWAMAPMLFFTFARNTISTYTLPALLPTSILMAIILSREAHVTRIWKFVSTALFAAVPLLAIIFCADALYAKKTSDKALVLAYKSERAGDAVPLVYLDVKRYFSADFYTGGKAVRTADFDVVTEALTTHGEVFVVTKDYVLERPHGKELLNIGAEPLYRQKDKTLFVVRK